MHSCLTRLISNINNRNKLQLMQIIWNVMLYSQHFTFHWKLLVYFYHRRSSNSSSSRCRFLRRRMKVDALWVTCSLPTTCLKRRQAIKCPSDAPICVLIPSSPSPSNVTIINHPPSASRLDGENSRSSSTAASLTDYFWSVTQIIAC